MSKVKEFFCLEQYSVDYEFLTEKKYTEETGLSLPKIGKDKPIKESKITKNKKKQSVNKKTKKDNKDTGSKKVDEIKPNIDDAYNNKNEVKDCVETAVDSKEDTAEKIGTVHESIVKDVEKQESNTNKKDSSLDIKTTIHDIKTVPTSTENKGFISAVGDSMKIKHEREKEELSHIDKAYPYKAANLLTNAEKQLFLFMENNLVLRDRIRIIPKVRLADVIQVEERLCKDKKALWKITSKHVDYIIVDRNTFDLICVVELDDYTHETPEAKERDELVYYSLLSAGLQLYRIKCKIAEINVNHLRGIDECILMY